MVGLAAPTPYDLRFRLLDIPVRVHPLFWLVMALISGGGDELSRVLIFIACAFVSILVHEFGHGLMARSFGYQTSEIVLYGMGGYCLCEVERQRPGQRLAVLLAGPGAGFLLLGVVCLVVGPVLGVPPSDGLTIIGRLLNLSNGGVSPAFLGLSEVARSIYFELIVINLMWGIFNLFPIWPLDGGRIAEVLLTMHDGRHGTRRAHVVSLLTAGLLGVLFLRWEQTFMALWFAYFAFVNYQMLQALHHSARYGTYDDADRWQR